MGNTQRLGKLVNGFTVLDNGNVGIGTSNPGRQVEIYNATDAFMKFNGARSGNAAITIGTEAAGFVIYDDTNSAYRLVIKQNGNVGIGTSSPTAKLEITNGRVLLNNGYSYQFINTASTAVDTLQMYTDGNVYLDAKDSTGGNLIFRTSNSVVERMRILTGGALCVGMTTSPYSNFSVKASTTTIYSGINCFANGNGNFIALTHDNNVGWITTDYATGGYTPIAFSTNNVERMRIGIYGDIGAMTSVTGQGSSLGSYRNFYWGAGIIMGRDSYDSYLCGNVYYDGSWRLKYGGYFGNVVNWYGGEYSFQRTNSNGSANSTVGLTATFYIDYNGNVVARGSVSGNGNPSDINLKENLVKISSPLDKISQINGYNFDWKQGSPANGLAPAAAAGMEQAEPILNIIQDAGLIAQEVEEIMPELVRDNGHKSLNYNGITALLVECIKELKAEIEILKNK